MSVSNNWGRRDKKSPKPNTKKAPLHFHQHLQQTVPTGLHPQCQGQQQALPQQRTVPASSTSPPTTSGGLCRGWLGDKTSLLCGGVLAVLPSNQGTGLSAATPPVQKQYIQFLNADGKYSAYQQQRQEKSKSRQSSTNDVLQSRIFGVTLCRFSARFLCPAIDSGLAPTPWTVTGLSCPAPVRCPQRWCELPSSPLPAANLYSRAASLNYTAHTCEKSFCTGTSRISGSLPPSWAASTQHPNPKVASFKYLWLEVWELVGGLLYVKSSSFPLVQRQYFTPLSKDADRNREL